MSIIIPVIFLLIGYGTAHAQTRPREVAIQSDSIRLYGTLVNPQGDGNFPVALLISGSGPTDRDGNSPGLKNNSLKLLAEGLAQAGIASLRYDKRGVGASADTTIHEKDLRFDDYIHDAENWLEYLNAKPEYDAVYVIGHSEGALIGLVAAQSADVQKYVSLAGAGKPADAILLDQIKSQSPFLGIFTATILDTIKAGKIVTEMPKALEPIFRPSVQPYLRSWIKYEPAKEIAKLSIPVLIVQGTTDLQVDVEDARALKAANPDAKLLLVEGMNHILKDVPEAREANFATYSDSTLALSDTLVPGIAAFLKDK